MFRDTMQDPEDIMSKNQETNEKEAWKIRLNKLHLPEDSLESNDFVSFFRSWISFNFWQFGIRLEFGWI